MTKLIIVQHTILNEDYVGKNLTSCYPIPVSDEIKKSKSDINSVK